MLRFSMWSSGFTGLGLLLFGLHWMVEGYVEVLLLTGVLFLGLGAIFSFTAMAKREKGVLQFVSLFSCFLALFMFTWFEPFQVLRMMTWLKQIG